jgi:hypothetical protein
VDTFAVRKNREYDRLTLELIRRVVVPSAVTVDAGANEGLILAELLRVAPRGRHHAFEPIPTLADRLRRQFPTSIVHEIALESSLLTRPDRESGRDVVELLVRVCRLDDVLDPTEQVGFMKIDVEGAEIDLLRGAQETLRRSRPVVVIECHVARLGEVTDLFEAADLRVHLMDDFVGGIDRSRVDVERLAVERGEFYFVAAPDRWAASAATKRRIT